MKKLFSLFIIFLLCLPVCGCNTATPKPAPARLPQLPAEMFAITEISDAAMAELHTKVYRLTVNDFIHRDRLAQFEDRGIDVSVQNIHINDCNSISFDLVLGRKFDTKLVLPATGMLEYRYLPEDKEQIDDLLVVWGNIAIADGQIAFVNINTVSLWNADTFRPAFRQPDMSFVPQGGIYFLLDAVKSNDGYLMPYFTQADSGFVHVSEMGKIVTTPVTQNDRNYTMLGRHSMRYSEDFNTFARPSGLLHCFYGESSEKQLFMAIDRVYGYYGNDYTMYDFDLDMFVHSNRLASVHMEKTGFDIYGMTDYTGTDFVYKGSTFLAVKKDDGKMTDFITFPADADPLNFGRDSRTGWNTNMYISLSENLDAISVGCKNTGMVITADFSAGTATVTDTQKMPQMDPLATTSTGMHKMYRVQANGTQSLVARCLSGYGEMDWLADVQGTHGTDWLAGFYNVKHNQYAYILTKDRFIMYSWEGSNYWKLIAYINGDYPVTAAKATQLCGIYKY